MTSSIDGPPPVALLLERRFRRHQPGRAARIRAAIGQGRQSIAALARAAVTLGTDIAENRRDPAARLIRVEGAPGTGGSLLLYAHFVRHGGVSPMVLLQLREYARLGFRVVFITGAALPEADWRAVCEVADAAVQRRNFGLDFGAWSDALRTVLAGQESWDELLLANDSVIGPLRPLDPVLARLRAAGDGVFGLTEGVQHGSHLQSYFVLARGHAATSAVVRFLRGLTLSDSKSRTIRRGELGLSRKIRQAGLPLAAMHGYAELERLAAGSPAARESLAVTAPGLARVLHATGRSFPLRRAMLDMPLNPMHHFAALLVHALRFPFVKTELLLANPVRVPEALDWHELIPADASCGAALAYDHLIRLALGYVPDAARPSPRAETAPAEHATPATTFRAPVPMPPTDPAYAAWIAAYDTPSEAGIAAMRRHVAAMARPPLISVVMPVHNPPAEILRAAILSVRRQVYGHWELCIADDASSSEGIAQVLREEAEADPRIRWVRRDGRGGIAAATNTALAMARGEFVALLDQDDLLAERALYEVAAELERHPDADLIYSDEDKLDALGRRHGPYFKPDWSPSLMLGQNMISHLGVYRRDLVEALGGMRPGLDGSQDHDLALRVAAATLPERIRHIPAILYHWRQHEGSGTFSASSLARCAAASRQAVADTLLRAGVRGAEVTPHPDLPQYNRVRWPLPGHAPLVTAIVTTRDRADLLSCCLDGLLRGTDYPALEVLVVDNDSVEPATLALFARLCRDPRVRVVRHPGPFDYAAMNNAAAAEARGEVLLLLNNDTEVTDPSWLREMVSHALRPEVGAVGALLYYPDGRIQHAGVVLGLGAQGEQPGVAGHDGTDHHAGQAGEFGRLALVREVGAVTAACMVLRRAVFEAAGGFDAEALKVAFNDVDLCLRIRSMGLLVVQTPFARLVHHESASRGSDLAPGRRETFAAECATMLERWGPSLQADPYHNPNLSLEGNGRALASPPRGREAWQP